MFGGGGMNPRKMKQMMEQMGIDVTDLEAAEVVIRTDDGNLVFDAPQVTRMDAQGQQTYQIVGEPEHVDAEAGDGDDEDAGATAIESASAISDEDVQIVANRAGVTEEEAIEALEDAEGDLAAAIASLE